MSAWDDTIEMPAMTPRDVALAFQERRSSFGEFYGANVALGFDATSPKVAFDLGVRGGPPAQFAADGTVNPNLMVAPEDRAERLDPSSVGITKDHFDELRGKREIPFDPFMTEEKAQSLIAMNDTRTYREWLVAQRRAGVVDTVGGFMAQMVGSIPDPINFVPLGGPSWRAAMAVKQAERAAYIMRAAGRGAVEAGVGTALLEPFVAIRDRNIGHDMSFAEATMDILIGAALGGAVGAGGAWWNTRGAPVGDLPPPAPTVETRTVGGGDTPRFNSEGPSRAAPTAERAPDLGSQLDAEIARLAAERSRPPMPSPDKIAIAAANLNLAVDDVVSGRAVDLKIEPAELPRANPDSQAARIEPTDIEGAVRAAEQKTGRIPQVVTVERAATGEAPAVRVQIERSAVSLSATPDNYAAIPDVIRTMEPAERSRTGAVVWRTMQRGRAVSYEVRPANGAQPETIRVKVEGEPLGPMSSPTQAAQEVRQRAQATPGTETPAGVSSPAGGQPTRAAAPLSDTAPIPADADPVARMEAEAAVAVPADSADTADAFPEAAEYEAALAEGRVGADEIRAVEAADEGIAKAAKQGRAYEQAAICILGGIG